jgi:hypothetical protein
VKIHHEEECVHKCVVTPECAPAAPACVPH